MIAKGPQGLRVKKSQIYLSFITFTLCTSFPALSLCLANLYNSFSPYFVSNLAYKSSYARSFAIPAVFFSLYILFLFIYLYIYPPDSQESDGGANIKRRQLPRPASADTKILLSACNLILLPAKYD